MSQCRSAGDLVEKFISLTQLADELTAKRIYQLLQDLNSTNPKDLNFGADLIEMQDYKYLPQLRKLMDEADDYIINAQILELDPQVYVSKKAPENSQKIYSKVVRLKKMLSDKLDNKDIKKKPETQFYLDDYMSVFDNFSNMSAKMKSFFKLK